MIKEHNDKTHGNWFSCDNGIIELQLTVKNEEARKKFLEFWKSYDNNILGNYRNGITDLYKDDNYQGVLCSKNQHALDHFIKSLEAISDEIKSNYGIPVFTW